MKLQFVCYDNIDVIKSNLDSWVNKFKQPSSDWLSEELNQPLFSDTKFKEIKDFSLDMSADPKKAFLTEAENAIRVYSNLKFLTDSQASDERLWAGLCLGPFWTYVQYRWGMYMEFFASAVDTLKVLVMAIGCGLGAWGIVNLLEGYGADNPASKSQGMKQFMAN